MRILQRFRSSRTGRYVNKREAQANKDTTYASKLGLSVSRNVTFVDAGGNVLKPSNITAGMVITGTDYGLTHGTLTITLGWPTSDGRL